MGERSSDWAALYDVLSGDLDVAEVATHISAACDAQWAAICLELPDGSSSVVSSNLYARLPSDYTEYYAARDPWRIRRPRGFDEMIDVAAYLPEEEWRASELYNDLLRPNGVDPAHSLTGAIRLNGLGEAIIGVGRASDRKAFSPESVRVAASALPHLKRIFKLKGVLDAAQASTAFAEAALDAFPVGVVRLDAGGRVLAENRSASSILERGDALTVRGGKLVGTSERADLAIQEAVQSAIHRSGQVGSMVVVQRGPNTPPYVMMFAPLSRRGGSQVLAVINAPEANSGARQTQLAGLYRLSTAEAALAIGLLEGRSLAEIADAKGASVNTLRVQLRSILRKTGTSRQAELVALLSRMPMLRSAD